MYFRVASLTILSVANAFGSPIISLKTQDYCSFTEQGQSRIRSYFQGFAPVDQQPLNLAVNTNPTGRARQALSALQIWYNGDTGLWNTEGWWNSANTITMIANLAEQDQSSQVQDLVKSIFSTTIVNAPAENPGQSIDEVMPPNKAVKQKNKVKARNAGYHKSIDKETGKIITTYPEGWNKIKDVHTINTNQVPVSKAAAPNPKDWLSGYYDDDLWWALGWITAYDVTKKIEYLQLAEGIFMEVTKMWPTPCYNGGIWWSYEMEYVNAIANELFLSTAAHLANRAENKSFYVDWAKRELEWFLETGIINENSTINDGLNNNCDNNGMTTWSYNQGVILGGLVELNKAASDPSYLVLAADIAKAAIAHLTDGGILFDNAGSTDGNAQQFKGIFARNLQLLHEAQPDDEYVDFIQKNANSIWDNNRNGGNMFGFDWAGPFEDPATAATQTSAMDALVAAITVK
ncbi:glycoside hydrolase family 76 protein [Zopfia rhizophila CBS 207.26]|uniref:Glycoside hydrolase family 76 protein n=1 Tax=Zopfia rhizophila CBS 207.26 TaxID=1314779 RepID=A0A6A6DUN3_9PEZI|nr:glycoside hydrolase family 76 protein [Zopfia rhizophila CBS 207.26]